MITGHTELGLMFPVACMWQLSYDTELRHGGGGGPGGGGGQAGAGPGPCA